MNVYRSVLVAAALAAGMGTTPLFAQGAQPSMSAEGMTRLQVQAKIVKIDKKASTIMIETKDVPGHTGAELRLPFIVTEAALLEKYDEGDKITADIIVTDQGPRVEAINPGAEAKVEAKIEPSPPTGTPVNPHPSPEEMNRAEPPVAPAPTDPSVSRGRTEETPATPDTTVKVEEPKADVSVGVTAGEKPKSEEKQYDANNDPNAAGAPKPVDKRVPFTGKVSSVNPSARQLTIAADNIPGDPTGVATLPYTVPDSVSIEQFHDGDMVTGELVVSENRTFVENVKIGAGIPEEKDSGQPKDNAKDKTEDNQKDGAKKDAPKTY